ncbi:MAG: hypothetical protein ABIO92_03505 [Chloroflexia bacterium]
MTPTTLTTLQLVEIPEGTPYRQTIAGAASITAWIEAGAAGSGWPDSQASQNAAQKAITSSAPALLAVDYVALALPDFVTTTRTLNLEQGQMDGRDLWLDAFGSDAQGGKWALYAWQGPEIPQLSDRPLVHRWMQVFALVDLSTNRVNNLFPSIVGQVYE